MDPQNTADKVLDPPREPTQDEDEAINGNFDGKLTEGWKIVYQQDSNLDTPFLCSNWAEWRVKGQLVNGKPVPEEPSWDTTDYNVGTLADEICNPDGKWKLRTCSKDDADRILVLWAVASPGDPGNYSPQFPDYADKDHFLVHHSASIGHMSPRHNDQWESKLSLEYYVITHGEMDFLHFGEFGLSPAVYFKRY